MQDPLNSPQSDTPQPNPKETISHRVFELLKEPIVVVALIGLVGAIIAATGGVVGNIISRTCIAPPPTPTPIPITSKFSFESGIMGWKAQSASGNLACSTVSQSNTVAYDGQSSLMLSMDLRPGDPDKDKGEAWIDLRGDPVFGKMTPLDLTGHTVTVWIYAPPAATGDPANPNGFQVFVKDDQFIGQYGTWYSAIPGIWIPISLTVGLSQTGLGSFTGSGFNPGRIIAIGVKMGAGGGAKKPYNGPVYIDAIDWN